MAVVGRPDGEPPRARLAGPGDRLVEIGITPSAIRRSISRILRKAPAGMSDDHEEIVQTVFLKLLELRQAGATERAWTEGHYVRAMARNATWDLLRSRRRNLFVADVLDQSCDERVTDLLEEATLAVLHDYIAGLPADLAAVFRARFVRGLSQARVCGELAISRQHLRTLEQRLKDGAARLLEARDCLEPAATEKRQQSRKTTNQNDAPPRL